MNNVAINGIYEKEIHWIEILCINLFTLTSFRFFDYNLIPEAFARLCSQASVAIMLVYIFPTMLKKSGNIYFNLMKCILLWTILSIFFALVFWGQGLFAGFRGTSVALCLCFFFYLIKRRISIDFLKKYVLCWSVIYILLWMYGLSMAPEPVFTYAEETDDGFDVLSDARGIFRINLVGLQLLILGWFICFDNILKKHYKYLIPGVIIYFIIILQLTRQIILWTALVSVCYYFYYHRKAILWAVLAVIVAIITIGSVKIDDDGVLGGLWAVTEMELEENKGTGENIRITEYKVMFTEWAPNPIAYIVGSGYPHASSPYGRYEKQWKLKKIYLGDVGYGKMMATIGLIGLIFFIVLFIRCFKSKTVLRCRFAKMYMIYLIPAHIGAAWYCLQDGQIAICICVYAIMIGNMEWKDQRKKLCQKKYEIQRNSTSI